MVQIRDTKQLDPSCFPDSLPCNQELYWERALEWARKISRLAILRSQFDAMFGDFDNGFINGLDETYRVATQLFFPRDERYALVLQELCES